MQLARVLGWSLLALVVSAATVRAAIAYALRQGMLDRPGQRRSHVLPTPRGGGVGVVVACLIGLPGILLGPGSSWSVAMAASLVGALALVAGIGWWDDHRPLRQWPRLIVQVLATGWFSAMLLATGGLSWWWLPLLLLAGCWSINLHNFMDGIDALLVQQALVVALGLGGLAFSVHQVAVAGAALVFATSVMGFGWFNRPPARIFMGDVGSGSVGFMVFGLSALCWRADRALVWPALLLSSSFLIDASFTLLNRFARGRRWYAPHREHLYQWLVRCGRSHSAAAACYLAWNLLIAVPAAVVARLYPAVAFALCVAVYTAGGATWIVAKRRCVRRVSRKDRHVTP